MDLMQYLEMNTIQTRLHSIRVIMAWRLFLSAYRVSGNVDEIPTVDTMIEIPNWIIQKLRELLTLCVVVTSLLQKILPTFLSSFLSLIRSILSCQLSQDTPSHMLAGT